MESEVNGSLTLDRSIMVTSPSLPLLLSDLLLPPTLRLWMNIASHTEFMVIEAMTPILLAQHTTTILPLSQATMHSASPKAQSLCHAEIETKGKEHEESESVVFVFIPL